MIFAQSAKIGRGELQVTTTVPDPDSEGQMREAVISVDAVIVKYSLGAAGDVEIALDPALADKIADAQKRAAGGSQIAPASLADMPKGPVGPVGIRDGVRQR